MLSPLLLRELSGFAREDVLHIIPLLLAPFLERDPQPFLTELEQQALSELAVRAGLLATDSADGLTRKMDAFYGRTPPKPDLVHAVRRFIQSHSTDQALSDTFAKILGTSRGSLSAVVQTGSPGAGLRGALGVRLCNRPLNK